MPPLTFKKADVVAIKCEGLWTRGVVLLASSNSVSLMLEVDRAGGYIGMLPLLWDEAAASYVDLVHGDLVTVIKDEEYKEGVTLDEDRS